MDLVTNWYLAATQSTNATHMYQGVSQHTRFDLRFFKFDPHCVYVVRFVVSDEHILWLGLCLLLSMGVPVQSDCRIVYQQKTGGLCATRWLMSRPFVRKVDGATRRRGGGSVSERVCL